MATSSEKNRYKPPIDEFWEITRALQLYAHDPEIKGRSGKLAIAAGVGLLATGTGFFPALAGVAVTMVVANAAQGLFDRFKRTHGKITEQMLLDEYASLIKPTSSASADKKAHSYLNFQEMFDRFSESNPITYEHLDMMVNFRDLAHTALEHEQRPYANYKPAFALGGHLYGTPLYTVSTVSDIRVTELAPEVATRCYEAAMSENMPSSPRLVITALLAQGLVKTRGPAAYQEAQTRRKNLSEKAAAINNDLNPSVSNEIEILTPEPRVTGRDEIAAAVLDARNGVRLETTPNSELKTSEEILAGHTKLYDVLRHAYKTPIAGPSDLASLEIIHNFSENIEKSLQDVDISDPIHEKMTQLRLAAEDFRKATFSAVAKDLEKDLPYANAWIPRSDDLLKYTGTLARYSVLCEHLDWQYQLLCAQPKLSDLSTRLTQINITGLDPKTLGEWTIKSAETLIQSAQPVVDQVLARLAANAAELKKNQNEELATESPAPS